MQLLAQLAELFVARAYGKLALRNAAAMKGSAVERTHQWGECIAKCGIAFGATDLSVLKDADLIRDDRQGKFIYYELNASVLEEIMLWVTDLKGGN